MGGDAQIVPGGGLQIEYDVVVVGLHIVGDLIPFKLITASRKRETNSALTLCALEGNLCALSRQLPFLALYDEVGHGAAAIFPGLEVQ